VFELEQSICVCVCVMCVGGEFVCVCVCVCVYLCVCEREGEKENAARVLITRELSSLRCTKSLDMSHQATSNSAHSIKPKEQYFFATVY
jgi:hypothetical protein